MGSGMFTDSRVEKPTRGVVAAGVGEREPDIWERPGGRS